jgi:hypothetical protein
MVGRRWLYFRVAFAFGFWEMSSQCYGGQGSTLQLA